jgi:O-antigen/teichoic acid export membrane protein
MHPETSDRGRDEYAGPATGGPITPKEAPKTRGTAPERAAGHFPDRIQMRSSAADRETWPVQVYDAQRARQEAGLAALIGIAVQVSLVLSEAATTIISNAPSLLPDPGYEDQSSRGLYDSRARRTNTDTPQGRLRLLLTRLWTDHLVRNSLYLLFSSGIQAALGFTFWIVMARLFSTGDVGRASSLISATAVIAYFALFGLNSTLVRFLPTARDKGSLITAALILVAGSGAAIGLAYILLTPVLAPRLAFVEHRPALTAGFVLLTAAAAVNLLTDSVFIASRKADFCALTDGVVGGLSKIVFGVIFVGTGAYGLFCASAGGFAAAALVSVVLIVTAFHWHPSLKKPFQTLKPLLRFSGANYLANALILLPSVVVPLTVLDRLGAQAAAYYFVAFQMAALLFAAVYAVEQAFLAEGSQAEADWRAIRSRSRRLAIMLFAPGGGVLALTAHWVLLAFGSRYSQHGTTSLDLLAVAVIPIAACNWSWTVLRLSGRLAALVVSSAVYSSAICGFAWILASHGLATLTAAWPVGSTFAAAIATVLAAMASGKPPARHRRTTRPQPSPPASALRRPDTIGTPSPRRAGRRRKPRSAWTRPPAPTPVTAPPARCSAREPGAW